MIKKAGVILFVVALIFISIYISLPSTGKITITSDIKASASSLYRVITDQSNWDKYFSDKVTVTKPLRNAVDITVSTGESAAAGNIMLVPLKNDSTRLYLSAELPNYDRISQYSLRRRLETQLKKVIDSISIFSKDTKNVYGIKIAQASTKDTFLLTKKFMTKGYPSMQTVYQNIAQIQQFATVHGAGQAGNPMLNTTVVDGTTYKCMVGLPVDRLLHTDSSADISFVTMIRGRFLTTEVKGGPKMISHAHTMMQQYFSDYKRTAMAIPFEYLVTNRLIETDTTKWITLIYAPVF